MDAPYLKPYASRGLVLVAGVPEHGIAAHLREYADGSWGYQLVNCIGERRHYYPTIYAPFVSRHEAIDHARGLLAQRRES
ncbi:MAG TPA: hypothetical protein VMT24_18490 [Aggregatilineaceae bacterium]|nr:hypothetical protein [Aggregatilineaceae bacterium]